MSNTEEFNLLKQELPKVTIGGRQYWLAQGDLRLDLSQLITYAIQRVEARTAALPSSDSTKGLILDLVEDDGDWIRNTWEPGVQLTWWLDPKGFTADQVWALKANLTAAGQVWNAACNVEFSAAATEADAVFRVEKHEDLGDAAAVAFFPKDPVESRVLVVGPVYFTTEMDPVGIFRHEFGHILGFRHEHIHWDAPATCDPDSSLGKIEHLTNYSPDSCMHYPCYPGRREEQRKFILSISDIAGAREIYGPPEIPPCV